VGQISARHRGSHRENVDAGRARSAGGTGGSSGVLSAFAIEVDKDLVRVALTGSLDIYTVRAFRRDVDPYADAGDHIVIDFSVF